MGSYTKDDLDTELRRGTLPGMTFLFSEKRKDVNATYKQVEKGILKEEGTNDSSKIIRNMNKH